MIGHRRPGGPEATRADHLVPGEREVGAGELRRIRLHQILGGLHPVLEALGAQVHGPEALIARAVHAPDLLGDVLDRDLPRLAQSSGAEEAIGDDRDSETGEGDGEIVRDRAVRLDELVHLETGGQAARGVSQAPEHVQLPERGREVGPEVPERDARDLVLLAQGRHLLDHPLPLREGGGIGVNVVLDVGPVVGQETHQQVRGGVSHRLGGDGLHHADRGDGNRLFLTELTVLAEAIAHTGVVAVDLEGNRGDRVPGEELAAHDLRDAAEVSHGDWSELVGLEPDDTSRDHPADPVAGGAAEQVEQAAVVARSPVLEEQAGSDVPIVGGLVVGEGDVESHSARRHGPNIDPDDALPSNRRDDAVHVAVDEVSDLAQLDQPLELGRQIVVEVLAVALVAGDAGDVDAVHHRDRLHALHEGEHEGGIEGVGLRPDDVLDAGDGIGVGSGIHDHDVELGECTAQQRTRHRVTHQAAPPEDDDGSACHGNLHTQDC